MGHSRPVWQYDQIKSSQIFQKAAQKVAKSYQKAPTLAKYLGYFSDKIVS